MVSDARLDCFFLSICCDCIQEFKLTSDKISRVLRKLVPKKKVVKELPQCIALIARPPHYLQEHRCPNAGKIPIWGYLVCRTYARVARRWDAEKRLHSIGKVLVAQAEII